ncbi:Hsp20/alpha crystallin family protein [Candidatus Parcubacteria bacterium]|nr:Hsp20/alpha crystallin family protein [Candidatus Parcubacteria bacterium]
MPKTKKKTKEKKEEEGVEIDFGIGKLSFGGIFKGIGDLIDLAAKMEQEGKGEIKREGRVRGLGDRARGVYGFTMRTGLGGKPRVEPFGNVRRTPKGPVIDETREPIVDVFDEKDYVLVVAELPGVDEAKIETKISGQSLIIKATNAERKYEKEVLLPAKVAAQTLKKSYKNGILEIRIKKKVAGGKQKTDTRR